MRYKKILLVNPYIPKAYMGPIRPPIGLGYLAETLNTHSIEYDVLDMTLGYKFKDLSKKISGLRPDIIGVTVWTYMYKNTYALIEAIKKTYPAIPIVAGGPHISTLRENVLKECSAIDFGVVLEGEMTLLELASGVDPGKIKGLLHRPGGNAVIYNGDREFIANLDLVPFPRFEKFEMKKYFLKEILIVSSRGCPYSCTYCPVSAVIGKLLRTRGAENVVEEIIHWYNRGYKIFNFSDDNFTFFKDRVYEICEKIERRKLEGLALRCGNGVRADKVDRKLLERMKSAGFKYIAFGVEAGNNRILQRLKKGERIEDIEAGIKEACNLGFDVTLFFLVGSPGESWQDIEDSIGLAKKYPVTDARFYNIIPYPSTELFDYLKEKNLFLRQPREYLNDTSAFNEKPVFQTPELSGPERIKALRILKKVRNDILKRALKNKLKKYGIVGRVAAVLFGIDFVQYIARHNKLIRRMAENVRYEADKFS